MKKNIKFLLLSFVVSMHCIAFSMFQENPLLMKTLCETSICLAIFIDKQSSDVLSQGGQEKS